MSRIINKTNFKFKNNIVYKHAITITMAILITINYSYSYMYNYKYRSKRML